MLNVVVWHPFWNRVDIADRAPGTTTVFLTFRSIWVVSSTFVFREVVVSTESVMKTMALIRNISPCFSVLFNPLKGSNNVVSMTPQSEAIYRVLARPTLTLLTTAGTEMPMTESLSMTTVNFRVTIYSVFYGGVRAGSGDEVAGPAEDATAAEDAGDAGDVLIRARCRDCDE